MFKKSSLICLISIILLVGCATNTPIIYDVNQNGDSSISVIDEDRGISSVKNKVQISKNNKSNIVGDDRATILKINSIRYSYNEFSHMMHLKLNCTVIKTVGGTCAINALVELNDKQLLRTHLIFFGESLYEGTNCELSASFGTRSLANTIFYIRFLSAIEPRDRLYLDELEEKINNGEIIFID